MFRETFKTLSAGILEGFGKDFPKVRFNSPDFAILNELSYNVGVFSIFKNHDQIKETVRLLKDEDGNLRSKKDFITEAQKLSDKYNKRYLATEYDQAVASARMAKKWQDIERTRKQYPNLMYVAVIDDRTRELHKQWHGIILPIDHTFWNTHYPPNDWGCRCSVRRTDKAVDDKGVDVESLPNLPKQFNINVGKSGKVFNSSHPYFKTKAYEKVAYFALTSLLRFQTQTYYTTLKNSFPNALNTTIGKVSITNKAIKEALNQPHGNGYLKNNLLLKLKEVFKDMYYIGSADSLKASHWLQYHYFRVDAFKDMIVVIREDHKGKLYFYSIVDSKKTKL